MRRTVVLLLLFLSVAVILFCAADLMTGYDVYREVKYGDAEYETMDVFIPKESYETKSAGCVLLIHGGSWSGGDKGEEEITARYIANSGYIAVTMNYKLYTQNGDYSVDDVMDEIDAALYKIRSFASERGISVEGVATYGYSAGAHLSMLYAFSRADESLRFTANLAGPADLSSEIWGEETAMRIGEILSGRTFADEADSSEIERLLESFSPVSHISPSTPPTVFAYGGKDTVVSYKNGESLKAAFDRAGVKYDYLFFENSDHSMVRDIGKRIKFARLVIAYCEEYF